MEVHLLDQKMTNVTAERKDISFSPSTNKTSEILLALQLFEAHFSYENRFLRFVDIFKTETFINFGILSSQHFIIMFWATRSTL